MFDKKTTLNNHMHVDTSKKFESLSKLANGNDTPDNAHLRQLGVFHVIEKNLEKIKKSRVMWIPNFPVNNIKNPYGHNWYKKSKLLIGTMDFLPRSGNYNIPFDRDPCPLWYKLPILKYIDHSLSDLLDNRAMEIYKNAVSSSKEIAILWSGGIDSTMVLTSLLKHIPDHDKKMINVIFDYNCIMENFNFYKKYISNKLNCIHYSTFSVDESFLKKYILLHGDPADCLFGPSYPKYAYFQTQKKHLDPYKEHLSKMMELLNQTDDGDNTNFGEWFVKKISKSIEESGHADHISTIADFWWWAYFNFRWQFSCQRPLVFNRKQSLHDPISVETQIEYAKNVFLNTDNFQCWAYSNLKKTIPTTDDPREFSKLHKLEAKKYIFNFTKDENYLNIKKKLPAKLPSPGNKTKSAPIGYDEQFKSILPTIDIMATVRLCLNRYSGY